MIYCGKCGNPVDDGASFCTRCGAPMNNAAAPQPQPAPVYQYYAQPQPVEHKSSAISICAFIFSFIIAPIGLILGIIGLAKRNAGTKGLSVAAVIIGSIGTLIMLLLSSILVPAMIGYVNRSKQTSANSVAASVRSCITSVLTETDRYGYGMKQDRLQEFDITVNDRRWTVSAADPGNFFSDGNYHTWGNGASGIYDDVVKMPETGENCILLALADEFPDMGTGSIHIAVYNGVCTACAFTTETSGKLTADIDYPLIGFDGSFSNLSGWQNYSNSKHVVGLSPLR